ncbi:MAG TPA: hypothetical protein VK646_14055 [Actinomycetota bacterium]|nr:hypothetical protein [Actinomycetota bacterium]
MRLDERARAASEELRAALDALDADAPPIPVQGFHRDRGKRDRRRKVTAAAAAALIAVLAGALLAPTLRGGRTVPARPVPADGSILFGRWDARTQRSTWFTARPDGTHARSLGVVATCARWWPDGSKILITDDAARGPGHPLRPAVVGPDGSGLRALDATRDPALNLGCGDVSPDGRLLVLEGFNDRRPGVAGIYTVRASDGGALRRVTRAPRGGSDGNPVFSPDGSHVAFFRTRPGVTPQGAGALFVVAIDGSGLRRITPWGAAFAGPSWSPDGAWITFQQPYGQLDLVHPDGTGLRRVTLDIPAGAGAENPAWSPDGSWLVFTLTFDGHSNIVTVPADGGRPTRVTHDTGVDDQTPDWSAATG